MSTPPWSKLFMWATRAMDLGCTTQNTERTVLAHFDNSWMFLQVENLGLGHAYLQTVLPIKAIQQVGLWDRASREPRKQQNTTVRGRWERSECLVYWTDSSHPHNYTNTRAHTQTNTYTQPQIHNIHTKTETKMRHASEAHSKTCLNKPKLLNVPKAYSPRPRILSAAHKTWNENANVRSCLISAHQ